MAAVAAALMETGIPTGALNKLHFRTKSVKRMKLESALIEGMELYDNGTIAIVIQSLELMERLEATQRDAEDISSHKNRSLSNHFSAYRPVLYIP